MKWIEKLSDPNKWMGFLQSKGLFDGLSNECYVRMMFRWYMGKKLDLKDPQTFNEKLQWLKLNDIHPEYKNVVDKYEVRAMVREKIGEEILIPLCGLWEKASDIRWEDLPPRFVLKATHNSGGVIICSNKDQLDAKRVIKHLEQLMKRNYFWNGREYPYRDVKPRIVCEEFLEEDPGKSPKDYKILCFNGIPQNVMVCSKRETKKPVFQFYDFDWNFLPLNKGDSLDGVRDPIACPKHLDQMIEIAKILSEPFVVSRIDLYEVKGKVYFGEITLFPSSGFDTDISEKTDQMFGKQIQLPVL